MRVLSPIKEPPDRWCPRRSVVEAVLRTPINFLYKAKQILATISYEIPRMYLCAHSMAIQIAIGTRAELVP